MNRRQLLLAAFLAVQALPTVLAADARDPAARYEADKKLCAEESTSSLRMQCLRDAKEEYNKAVGSAATTAATTAVCTDCGKVVAVNVIEKKGQSTPVGMIAGGVVGAVLGNQIGRGTTRDVATVAGAAGGAYAGHKIEENARSSKSWSVRVRLDGGDERTFSFDHDPGFASGDAVKLSGNSIVRR